MDAYGYFEMACFVAIGLAAIMAIVMVPIAVGEWLRRRGFTSGAPPVSFWHMMGARVVMAAVFAASFFMLPESSLPGANGHPPGTGKAAPLVALLVVGVDAIAAIIRRLLRAIRNP